jgi:hypothetical protein
MQILRLIEVFIALHNNDAYDSKYVLSILSSKMLAFYFRYTNNEFDALFPKIRVAEFKKLPIKILPLEQQQPFIAKADIMLSKNKELNQITQQFTQLLQAKFSTNLSGASKNLTVLQRNVPDRLTSITITNKLQNWHSLTAAEFLKEISKQKIKLSLSEQQEWLQYFEEQKTKANAIQQAINQTDKEIDAMVYALYNLTEEEIKIVENV